MSALFVLSLLAVMVVLLVGEKFRADLVAVMGLSALIVSGILEPGEALEGLSNPATVSVGCMFVLSAGLQQSGLVRYVGDRLLKHGPKSGTGMVLLLGLLVGPLSAFLNNTAAVAVFLPIALAASRGRDTSPSRMLMPLSFFAMLGGTCTLIGTSTNILVSAAAEAHGMRPFGMFEFSLLGVALFAVGTVYLATVGMRLMPERVAAESLTEGYHLNAYLSEVVVLERSPLVGQTLQEAQLGERHDLEVLGLYRDRRISTVPDATRRLRAGDVLIVQAQAAALLKLRDTMGLAIQPGRHPDDADLRSVDSVLLEVVVTPNSRLESQTIKRVNFRRRYGALALAIRRHGEDMVEKIGRLRLRVGDELLVLARRESLAGLREQTDFVVLQELNLPVFRPALAATSVLIVAGVVASVTAGWLPIAEAAVVGAMMMVATRCLPVRKLYDAVDWKVIFLLAGLIPVGTALESSGAAELLVRGVLSLAGDFGPSGVLAVFFLLAATLTGFLSNNATAVLMAPLGISLASDLGVDARPFLIALTFAASAAFWTPIGYQTNLLVYSPGGYRFADYVRAGGPLNLIYWLVCTALIPLLFPF